MENESSPTCSVSHSASRSEGTKSTIRAMQSSRTLGDADISVISKPGGRHSVLLTVGRFATHQELPTARRSHISRVRIRVYSWSDERFRQRSCHIALMDEGLHRESQLQWAPQRQTPYMNRAHNRVGWPARRLGLDPHDSSAFKEKLTNRFSFDDFPLPSHAAAGPGDARYSSGSL